MYISVSIFVILVILGIGAYAIFYEAPTCFDGKQNGAEEGVDCGGTCELICSFSAAQIEVLYSRTVPLAGSVYSVVSVLENPNARAIARNVPYIIKMRDSEGLLVAEEVGTIDIPAQREIPVFVHQVDTGLRTPTRTDFELTGAPVWERVAGAPREPFITIQSIDDARVTATLRNPHLDSLEDLVAVVLVSDANGNVIAASQSKVAYIAPEAIETVVFTWPTPFTESAVSAEVLVRTPVAWETE